MMVGRMISLSMRRWGMKELARALGFVALCIGVGVMVSVGLYLIMEHV
jgi:hypothetical protein